MVTSETPSAPPSAPPPAAASDGAILRRITAHVGGPTSLRGYVWSKLRTDPAYRATRQILHAHPGPVLDIGCGLGLLEFFLREHGFSEQILGIDTDEPKIARARAVAARHYEGLTFEVADMARPLPIERNVVLLDVLHYLDDDAQAAFLERIADSLPPGGVAIIRNAPRDGTWRHALTYAEELWVRASRWIRASNRINFPTIAEVAAPFRARGFREEIRPLWGRTPFNSHLFVFQHPVEDES